MTKVEIRGQIQFHSPQEGGYRYLIAIYPIWDDGKMKDLTYFTDLKQEKERGFELYSGKNYIVGTKDRSHSRVYKGGLQNLPKKYHIVANRLIIAHMHHFHQKVE